MVSYLHETQIKQHQFLFWFTYINVQTIKHIFSLTIYLLPLFHIAQIFFFRFPMSHQVTNISERRGHRANVWRVHASPDVHRAFRAPINRSAAANHSIIYNIPREKPEGWPSCLIHQPKHTNRGKDGGFWRTSKQVMTNVH